MAPEKFEKVLEKGPGGLVGSKLRVIVTDPGALVRLRRERASGPTTAPAADLPD